MSNPFRLAKILVKRNSATVLKKVCTPRSARLFTFVRRVVKIEQMNIEFRRAESVLYEPLFLFRHSIFISSIFDIQKKLSC